MRREPTHPVLFRAAALPVRFWLMAANPALFRLVQGLGERTREARGTFQEVAEAIGARLVPLAGVGKGERARLLALRRDLHAGRRIDAGDADLATAIAAAAGAHDLAADLERCRFLDRDLAEREERLDALIEAEPGRLLGLPPLVLSGSPIAGAILGELGSAPPTENPLKKQRRFFERSWHYVTRAATDPTPRGWMSHLGVAATSELPRGAEPLACLGRQAHVHETESVRGYRRGTAGPVDPEWPQASDRLGANPLSWSEEGEHISIVLDRDAEMSCVVLRETNLLQGVLRALAEGPRPFAQLYADLDITNEADISGLRSFLGYLRQIGIVEACAAPLSAVRTMEVADAGAQPEDGQGKDLWIDVYRHVEPGLSAQLHGDLQNRLRSALAILEAAAPSYRAAQQASATAQSWTFAEVLKSSLVRNLDPVAGAAPSQGPGADDSAAGGQDVLDRLLPQGTEAAGGVVDLTLSRSGMTHSAMAVPWPVDCVVRLADAGAPYRYVLRSVWPAGTIDSRFSDGLRRAFGMTTLEDEYRSFLRQVEQMTGITFLEILAPPLSDRADNAVRRPSYTSMWTGDPNRDLYLVGAQMTERYAAPHRIEIAAGPAGMESRVDGRRIWPIYHATRTCSPPWDHISRVLLATAPLGIPLNYRNPRSLLMQSRARMPRIVLDGDLVLCPAQWLIAAGTLWPASAPLTAKVRRLAQLREQLGLPRWLEVSYSDDVDFVGCDLDSIEAIRLLERMVVRRGAIRLAEMLPTPDHLFLGDSAHGPTDRLMSEIVIRVPGPSGFSSLAEDVVREIPGY